MVMLEAPTMLFATSARLEVASAIHPRVTQPVGRVEVTPV